MFRYKLQINFIFVLYVIIQINCCISQRNEGNVKVRFGGSCMTKNCCKDFRKIIRGVVCEMSYENDLVEYTFEFTDIKCLPASVFEKKHIWRILMNDGDVTVDSNVLQGIHALREFNVLRSSIQVIPDFSFVNNSIKTIKITSSLLRSLTGNNLQNLTLVEEFSFARNFITEIDSNVFKGTVNVKIIDLSHNQLKYLPETLLNPMKSLSQFLASSNNLLHVNNLFSVTRPLTIALNDNNMTDIGSALIKNFIANKMTNYWMPHCDVKYDVTEVHSLLPIDTLDLSNNSFSEISQSIFPCFKSDWVTTGYFLEINELNLGGNSLKTLNSLLSYFRIITLKVYMNQIQYLTVEDFQFTTGIVNLHVMENKIEWIDTNTFKPFRDCLEYLDLSSNLITSLNKSMGYLTKLRKLKLGHNSIQSFAIDEFSGIEALTVLTLEHNQINTIDALQLKSPALRFLQYLNIKNNDIESIRLDPENKSLKLLHLAGNPIKRNCLFHLFIRRLIERSIASDIDAYSKLDFNLSNETKSHSQDMCSYRCTDNENDPSMFVDCSSKKLSVVPKFIQSNLMEVEISSGYWIPVVEDLFNYSTADFSYNDPNRFLNFSKKNIYSTFHVRDKVLEISLENNNLEYLETAQFPPNLNRLYLANNKLKRLHESIFENQLNLKVITLSGNPWKCNCDALNFKKWLTFKKAIIKDIDNVRCGLIGNEASYLNGRVILNLSDLDLCPADTDLLVSAPSGVLSFVILCLVAKVLYTKNEHTIKVILYSYGIIPARNLEYAKTFDAFISFSHDDDEFVIKEMISVIEKRNPNIRLCLHYRHFMPGELIITNITQAVQNSKSTVIILSRNFLKSEWCLLEFRTADSQVLEDKVHRIIMVKVGDLPDKIDPSIQYYLDSTTYITWGENNFWNKLLYVLPSEVTARRTNPENISITETVI